MSSAEGSPASDSSHRKVTREELCGRQKKSDSILEETFRLISQNRIGAVDYNKYGTVDNAGFLPVSEQFIDNFLFYVIVPSYRLDKGRYTEIGRINSTIVGLLKRSGLTKSTVKAVDFTPPFDLDDPSRNYQIPFADPEKVDKGTLYYRQVYKIATADENREYRETQLQLKAIKSFAAVFEREDDWMKLAELNQGRYDVYAIRNVRSLFGNGQTRILFINVGDELRICYANWSLNRQLNELLTPDFQSKNLHSGYLTLYNHPIAKLDITGQKYNYCQRNTVVFCTIALCGEKLVSGADKEREEAMSRMEEELQAQTGEMEKVVQAKRIPQTPLPILRPEDTLPYLKANDLLGFPKASRHEIVKIGFVQHRKTQKLLLELSDGKRYQAGNDLEAKVDRISEVGVQIVIGPTRTDKVSKRKYVQCEIVQPGDWTIAGENYQSLPYISSISGSGARISAIDEVIRHRQKRKIFLVDNGHVYNRAKKGKCENDLEIGTSL